MTEVSAKIKAAGVDPTSIERFFAESAFYPAERREATQAKKSVGETIGFARGGAYSLFIEDLLSIGAQDK